MLAGRGGDQDLAVCLLVDACGPMNGERLAVAATVAAACALRGHRVIRLADALRAAVDQLASARAKRRVVVLLSDCRHTDEDRAEWRRELLADRRGRAPARDGWKPP